MRKFLIILDDTPEMLNAMRYAAIRASKTGGGVEMLAVISPEEFQHFMGVADVMRAEAHEKIEAHFQVFKSRMEKREGITPTLAIREGDLEFLLADDGARTLAYLRRSPSAAAVIALNLSDRERTLEVPLDGRIPEGTVLVDALGIGLPAGRRSR